MKKVVIVGAGLGGLVSGAKLSKEGCSVTPIEKHYVVGGCATIFKRKSVRMEVSLHQLDELDKQDFKTDIFKGFTVFDEVKFISIAEFYSVKFEGGLYKIPTDAKNAIKLLTEISP